MHSIPRAKIIYRIVKKRNTKLYIFQVTNERSFSKREFFLFDRALRLLSVPIATGTVLSGAVRENCYLFIVFPVFVASFVHGIHDYKAKPTTPL